MAYYDNMYPVDNRNRCKWCGGLLSLGEYHKDCRAIKERCERDWEQKRIARAKQPVLSEPQQAKGQDTRHYTRPKYAKPEVDTGSTYAELRAKGNDHLLGRAIKLPKGYDNEL